MLRLTFENALMTALQANGMKCHSFNSIYGTSAIACNTIYVTDPDHYDIDIHNDHIELKRFGKGNFHPLDYYTRRIKLNKSDPDLIPKIKEWITFSPPLDEASISKDGQTSQIT